jgi:hypothetical protein
MENILKHNKKNHNLKKWIKYNWFYMVFHRYFMFVQNNTPSFHPLKILCYINHFVQQITLWIGNIYVHLLIRALALIESTTTH